MSPFFELLLPRGKAQNVPIEYKYRRFMGDRHSVSIISVSKKLEAERIELAKPAEAASQLSTLRPGYSAAIVPRSTVIEAFGS